MKELFILPIEDVREFSDEYCRENFPKRMERVAGFRQEKDKLRCIGAGALLCSIAGIRESEISYNNFGKPLCEGRQFSISHGGEFIILAIADVAVGTDVEVVSRKFLDVSKRVFIQEELAWMYSREENPEENSEEVASDRFFTLWTLKESIMKAEGKGLSMDPATFSVLPLIAGGSIEIGDTTYYGYSFLISGHRISVCSESKERPKIIKLSSNMILKNRWRQNGN